ncbi:MAG TPA: translocation/assembly module TamB domain-containing protein, partial [Candidatus Krumholzibacteria bacterium]|nr:translocation/assembly module TamB domain-containing protein [Candidatus Krumholzibacteria bacterium]
LRADTTRAEQRPASSRWTIVAERVRVRRGSVDTPGDVHLHDVDVVASGSLDGYRATVRAAGSAWRIDDARAFARVAGDLTAATADSLDVHALGGTVHGSAFVRWKPGLSWNARVAGDSLHVGALTDARDDWVGAITFRARGSGLVHDDTTRVGVDLASLNGTLRGKRVFARGRVDIDGRHIAASDAVVRWGSAHATLSGHMAETADVRLDATIPSLAELLPRAHGSARVRGRIDGSPERIRVQVNATATQLRADQWTFPDLDAIVDATLSARDYVPNAVEVQRADVHVAQGTLSASGRASWQEAIEWDARVSTQDLETSLLTPRRWDLHGPVSIRATSSGVRRGRTLRAGLELESLSGTLRDHALSGSGSVSVKNTEADFSNLDVTWGTTHLRADGHAGKTLDLDMDLAVPDLSMLVPSWHGALTVKGRAAGPVRKPAVNAVIEADSLRVHDFAVHHIEGHAALDPAFTTPADIDLTIIGAARGTGGGTNGSMSNALVDTVHVTATGPHNAHRLSLSAVRGTTRADITLQGAYADTSWSGTIEELELREPTAGAWHTVQPAPLVLARTHARLDSLTLVSNGAHVAINGSWRKDGPVRANAGVRGVALAVLQRYLPGTTITGTVDGTATFAMQPGAGVEADVDLSAGPGAITLGDHTLAYTGRVTGRAGKDGVSAGVKAAFTTERTQVATIDGALSIAGFVVGRDSFGSQPLDGRVDLECKDIGPVLAVFVPALAASSGSLSAHVKPVGTAESFHVVGSAALENARVDTPNGLHLRKTQARLDWDGEGRITMEGGATSGGRRMALSAKSARGTQGFLSGTFSAKGQRFQIINRPDAEVFVSPDLQLKVEARMADITGTVAVPYARIEVAQVPASAATPSPDVVVVEDTLAAKPRLQVRTQVRVALGDSVTFDGFGLQSRLSGSLAVDDERGRPTRGTGEIQLVDGKYRAFGNELKIDPGRLVFGGGPIDNPGIDLRAYRGLTTQNVMAASSGEIVGVKLRGTLRRPELTLFSNPPMSESEMMSYLLFGRSNNTGSGGEQSALASAAMLLSMQKGTQMAGDLGKKFSLDEAYLETGEEAREAAFVAGKYLSPKLYVSYAAGLFEHANTFRARYSLSGHWTLQAESGKDDSTDLLYWFEHGK